jgi:hypothetical protein
VSDIKDATGGIHREHALDASSTGSENNHNHDVEKRTHGRVNVNDPHLHDDDAVTLKTWAVVVVSLANIRGSQCKV